MSDLIVKAHEADNGDLQVHYQQDVEPNLEAAKAERNSHSSAARKEDFRKVMTVPFNVILAIMQETGLDFFVAEDAKEIYKILARPEFKNFRTVPDKHI